MSLASGLLVGCGGDDDGGRGDSSVVVLDDGQVKEALLTLDNMPEGWIESDDDDDDDDDAPGCLANLEGVEEHDSESDADVSYEVGDDFGLPALFNGVASFTSDRDATSAIDDFRDAFSDCGHLDYTDPEDGTQIVLDFETDDEKTTSDVDDQVNVTATGTISSGIEFPFGLWFSAARIDNHLTLVMVTDLSADSAPMLDPYVEIAVDRLVAVMNGDEPEETQGPGPASTEGAADSEEQGEDEVFQQLPLDGGSYTWESSGVTLTLAVERVEPYGKKDDLCGDGSCGVANPDDTLVVIRYDVTVPPDASEPFEASSCPGQMYPTSGSEDDALLSIYGEYTKSLNGKIFPGSTKSGVDEYVVEKAYADQEFYIESSCGDTDYEGETAYFVGTFDTAA